MDRKEFHKLYNIIGYHWIFQYIWCKYLGHKTMKHRYLSVLVVGIFSISGLKAQDKSNLVKLNLLPLSVGNIAIEYERLIQDRISLNGTLSLRPKSGLPFRSLWDTAVDDEYDILGAAKFGAFSFAPEVRFYLGHKDQFRGFYIAPFVKYANYSLTTKLSVDQSGYQKEVPISGDLDAFTAGVAIGSQWRLGNDIYLDWRIIGPNYGFNKGTFDGKTPLNEDEQHEVQKQLDDFDIDVLQLKKEVNAEGVTITTKGPFAGIRSALSVGYRF